MSQIEIRCPNPKCGLQTIINLSIFTPRSSSKLFTIRGILKCNDCGHERALILEGESIREITDKLPSQQSDKLNIKVPDDIKEDVKEAEAAYFNQCYKASAAMCRRAMQIALIEKGIQDKGLEAMIKEARNQSSPILTNDTYNFAMSIKGFGDIAVHRKEKIESDDIPLLLSCTRRVLNELFPD